MVNDLRDLFFAVVEEARAFGIRDLHFIGMAFRPCAGFRLHDVNGGIVPCLLGESLGDLQHSQDFFGFEVQLFSPVPGGAVSLFQSVEFFKVQCTRESFLDAGGLHEFARFIVDPRVDLRLPFILRIMLQDLFDGFLRDLSVVQRFLEHVLFIAFLECNEIPDAFELLFRKTEVFQFELLRLTVDFDRKRDFFVTVFVADL